MTKAIASSSQNSKSVRGMAPHSRNSRNQDKVIARITEMRGISSNRHIPATTSRLRDTESHSASPLVIAFMPDIDRAHLQKYNLAVMTSETTNVINAALDFFSHDTALTVDPEFNSAFIQIIHCAMDIPALKAPAITLYNRYLEQDLIRNLLIKPDISSDFGNYKGLPEWDSPDAQNYILLSPLNDQCVMMLSAKQFSAMRTPGDNMHWNNFFLYQDGKSLAAKDYVLKHILTVDFPLFATPYSCAAPSAMFVRLLNTLEPEDRLYKAFITATDSASSTTKLDKPEDLRELEAIFNQKLEFDKDEMPLLSPAHYEEIMAAYKISTASEQHKAATLLSLSAIFARYSSSAHFGCEKDSSAALRNYAAALLDTAHKLSPGIFGHSERFNQWSNKLLGRGKDTFTCTAILSGEMVNYATANFPAVLSNLLPPAWS